MIETLQKYEKYYDHTRKINLLRSIPRPSKSESGLELNLALQAMRFILAFLRKGNGKGKKC